MSREFSTRGLAAITLVSGVILALGVVLAVRPSAVLETVPTLQAAVVWINPAVVLLLTALVIVLFVPMLGVLGRIRAPAPSSLRTDTEEPNRAGERIAPEHRQTAAAARPLDPLDRSGRAAGASGACKPVGDSFDRLADIATGTGTDSGRDSVAARDRIVETLRPIAAESLADRRNLDRERALEAVVTGSWTDDTRAAAFLADESGPSIPVWLWVVDLLGSSEPFSRSLEHTLVEIETLRDHSRTALQNGTGPRHE